jgi:hypothetical protein
MTTNENQPQHVVVERAIIGLVRRRRIEQQFMRQLRSFAAKRDGAANAIDRLVAPDIDQPGARIGRQAAARPARQRHRESILQRILGEIEITDEADQGCHRPPRLVAKYFFDLGGGHGKSLTVVPGRAKREPGTSRFPDVQRTSEVRICDAPRNDGLIIIHKS